jgi:hypothetical protein
MGWIGVLSGTVISAVALSAAGCADDHAASPIGRVSAAVGSVQYRPAGGDWSDALINEPVASGTGLRSGRSAQAELRIGPDRVALAGPGELGIVRLDGEVLQIAVIQGRIGVHLDDPGAAKTVEIDLPQGGVWLTAPGEYDIAAGDAETPARVAVIEGRAELGGGLTDKSLVVAVADSFGDWWRGQSQGNAAAASDFVSPRTTGVETLAASGRWESDDTYGDVWFPSGLPEDWAPYRYGRWRFLQPWGWTWIDDAAWGFAPSHYGRWARINTRWAWAPGPRDGGSAYSPATVAFLGTAGVGISRPNEVGPAVGWFPLAPGETPDDPDARYLSRLFASVVPRPVFASGRPVQPALIQLPDQRLADAPIILGALQIGPAVAAAAARPTQVPAVGSKPVTQAKAREVFVARMNAVLLRMMQKKFAVAAKMRRARGAPGVLARPYPAPSTTAPHSAHNREHLAAARGGAEQ